MNIYTFHPACLSFVKNKAKQLQRSMPGMKLSKAQDATAVALGFSSWFDCNKRIGSMEHQTPNLYDEELDRKAFINRRHYQYCALVEAGGIPPFEAAHFVRAWALTSRHPSKNLSVYSHPYTELQEKISAVKSGAIDWVREGWENEPRSIAPGIAYGNIGTKRSYYVLNHDLYNKLPPYGQGNSCCRLDFESGLALPVLLSEFRPTKEQVDSGIQHLYENEPSHYEWLNQEECPHRFNTHKSLFSLLKLAEDNPDGWFPLSYRTLYPEHPSIVNARYYIPAAKGRNFARFIDKEGRISQSNIQWFEVVEMTTYGIIDFQDEPKVPLVTEGLKPCEPVYHSPFKHAPMGAQEFVWGVEGGGLTLDYEIDWSMG